MKLVKRPAAIAPARSGGPFSPPLSNLNNGNHRVYTLRALGITHAPCLIQRALSREELAQIATGGFRRKPEF